MQIKKPDKVTSWKTFFKRWSVWLNGLGGAILSWFAMTDPQQIASLWAQLPADIKDVFPPYFAKAFGMLMIAVGIISINVRQHKLRNKSDDEI